RPGPVAPPGDLPRLHGRDPPVGEPAGSFAGAVALVLRPRLGALAAGRFLDGVASAALLHVARPALAAARLRRRGHDPRRGTSGRQRRGAVVAAFVADDAGASAAATGVRRARRGPA